MDSSHLLTRQATNITEYKAGQKVKMRGRDPEKNKKRKERVKAGEEVEPEEPGVVINKKECLVQGFPESGHGMAYRPWFNWEEGIAGCTCPTFGKGEVSFCCHILGLFESLTSAEDKYGEKFLAKFLDTDLYSASLKTSSDVVSTGLDSVDDLLGGGIARAAVTLLAGPTKVGKTWFAVQVAFQAAMNGLNVLYIDSEGMFARQDGFGAFETILRKRFKFKGNLKSRLHFIPEYTLEAVAKYFGQNISISDYGNRIKAYISEAYKSHDTPIVHLCKAKKIDLVVMDSLTDLLKPKIGIDQQNLPARSAIINVLWPAFEGVARECDVGFILISHSTRSYEWQLYDGFPDKKKRGILDQPVKATDAGVWGASALMYNVKYFLQIENCTRDWCKKKTIKHFMRRLYPGQASTHVDLEMVRDYGYISYG